MGGPIHQETNPYHPPSQDESMGQPETPLTGGAKALASTSLQYRYLPRFKLTLRWMLYSLAFCAFSVWHAANDLHGLSFAGLIRLSPSQTTKLFLVCAIVSGLIVFFGISALTARFRPPRYLVLYEDILAIPVGRHRECRNVPYRSIRSIRRVGDSEQARLQITTDDGKATVTAFMLESNDQLLEVEAALRGRSAVDVDKHRAGASKKLAPHRTET
jgi:hypothetical protein